MYVYEQKAKARIKDRTRIVRSQCKQGKKKHIGEADTRAIVQTMLTDLLGWEMLADVTQETEVKGGYCDFMIHRNNKPYMVIEVKKISGGLTEDHLRQAKHYAQDKSINWVILTNGDIWEVYRLYYQKKRGANPEPNLFPMYSTSFLDTTINPNKRVELLYLLSKEATRHDELEAFYQQLHALSPEELVKRILRKDVVDRIRIGIKNDIDYRIDNEELAERITKIISNDALPANLNYWIKKSK